MTTLFRRESVASTIASVAEINSVESTDELFVRYSIPELRSLEKKTRADIESKRQELRLMVGERYRDLISAADAIVSMRKSAHMAQDMLENMQESCDVHKIKRKAMTLVKGDDDKAYEGNTTKRYLYSSAAQIKLLVDVPEQIYSALENNEYLNASRLYLVAKVVYRNLQDDDEDLPFNVSTTFPVVQRQWDAVSHFKAQIVQKSIGYLKVVHQSEQSVTETLLALMLLDDATPKDTFRRLLDMRMASILDISNHISSTDVKMLADRLIEIIEAIQMTLLHVYKIYVANNGISSSKNLLETYIERLQKSFTSATPATPISEQPPTPSPFQKHFPLLKLYNSSSISKMNTNLHLIARYLPGTIQTFTPFLNIDEQRGLLELSDLERGVTGWVNEVKNLFTDRMNVWLSNVKTGVALENIRNIIWKYLEKGEDSEVEWGKICEVFLHAPFSMWNDLLRNPINDRFREIVRTAFAEVAGQPGTLLGLKMQSLDDPLNEDHNLSVFTWNALPDLTTLLSGSDPASAADHLKAAVANAVAVETTIVGFARKAFEDAMRTTREDMKSILVGSIEGPRENDIFGEEEDRARLKKMFVEEVVRGVTGYAKSLEELLNGFVGKLAEEFSRVTLDKALVIGRISSAIGKRSVELEKAFGPFEREHTLAPRRFTYLTLHKKPEPDIRLSQLKETLRLIYVSSYNPWVQSTVAFAAQAIQEFLNESKWDDDCSGILVWEAVVQEGEKILLPAHASSTLCMALFGVCREIERVGSATLDQAIIQNIIQNLYSEIFKTYKDFIISEKVQESITEKGALQLFFDIQFLRKIFEGGLRGSSLMKADDILQDIKAKIDPINLAVFESHLETNVERFYARNALLLGLLVQLNSRDGETKRKPVTIQDYHNNLPIAPQAPRFALLPIGYKVGQRVRV